ncbi:hypothetical protein [Aeromonas hydrophila]|uniref:hypothetical protein n=1 Tax=Aeromonas hydrophila TaxID=644 RepID=UPI003EC4D887
MSKYGKEPWNAVEVKRDEDELIQIRASNGAIIARLWIDVDDKQFSDEQRENARRIVACANACRGLPTDELEQKGLVAAVGSQLLKADDRAECQEREIRRLASLAANAENQLADALNQHDELLAALELMVAIHDEPSGFSGKYGKALDNALQAQREKIDERLLVARATIAKAKGGAA